MTEVVSKTGKQKVVVRRQAVIVSIVATSRGRKDSVHLFEECVPGVVAELLRVTATIPDAGQLRRGIEAIVEKYCDGTLPGLHRAHFIEYFGDNGLTTPQTLVDDLVDYLEQVFGLRRADG